MPAASSAAAAIVVTILAVFVGWLVVPLGIPFAATDTTSATATATATGTPRAATATAGQRHRPTGTVDVLTWDHGDPLFLKHVVERGLPVVLRNTPVDSKWQALSTWSLEHIKGVYGPEELVASIHSATNPTVWMFKNETKLQQYPGTPKWHVEQALPLGGVLDRLTQPKKYGYYYVNIKTKDLGERLLKDVSPTRFFSPFADSIIETEQEQLVWIGSTGVTTQMHYDTDYNLNVQVTGQKRFLLLPPSFHTLVHIYPRAHQRHRRSQIDWGSSLTASERDWQLAEALVALPGAREVTLTKGDVLYLPPFWLHHVTNLNAGISVNVWTELTEHKRLIFDIRTAPQATLAAPSSPSLNAAYYALYLVRSLQHTFAFGPEQLALRLHDHWVQRYSWLASSPSAAAYDLSAELSDADKAAIEAAAVQSAKLLVSCQALIPDGFELTLGDFIDSTVFLATSHRHLFMGPFLVELARRSAL